MAINITTDILHSSDGKVAKVQQIAGGWQTLATKSDFNAFTTNSTTKQNLTNGQLFYVLDESTMYKLTVAGFPVKTYTLSTASLGTINTSSLVTTSSFNAATSSFVLTSQTGSFIRVSQTSSMSVLSALSASFISDTFISASAARSGFGAGGSTPDGTISSSAQISALGFITSSNGDVSALNLFTGSAQTSLTALNDATSSYLTSDITSSFVLISQTSSMNVLSALTASFISDSFISASAARSGFGSGGSTIPSGTISSSQQISDLGYITSSNADVSALNLFTGSAQTSLTALNAATSSYLTSADTASFVNISQTSSMSVLNAVTASYIDPTFISASAAAAGFGTGGSTDISDLNTFTGSAQTSLDALNAATSSYITNSQTSSMSVATASYVDPTFISASAAAAGFGSGGGSVGTLQQVTDQGSSTDVSMSIQKIEIFSGLGWKASMASSSLFIGENVIWAAKSSMSSSVLGTEGNTFLGGNAGRLLTGMDNNNTVIGNKAAYGEGLQTNNLGHRNTVVGAEALYKYRRGGGYNTALGAGSLGNFLSGSRNTAIGDAAGFNLNSGSNNIYIGHISQTGNANGAENEIVIGKGVIGNGSNTITIGNSDNTDYFLVGNLTGSITDVFISEWGSISASLASLQGGAGDITSVQPGPGMEGGATSGEARLTLDTSSQHFTDGVVSGLVGKDVVVNSITAETYIVSSSVTYLTTLFSSGSTIFGDDVNDTHQFTGSLFVLGGVTALSFTGSLFGTSSWAVNAVTASYIDPTFISASAAAAGFGSGGGGSTDISALNAFTGSAQTSLTALNSATASYITNSQTSSMTVLSASYATYAVTASYTENLIVGGGITGSNWSISSDGVMTLGASSPTTASAGSIYFDGTNFYFGV